MSALPPPPPPPPSEPLGEPPGTHALGPAWGQRQPNDGLRKAVSILFWCATAATALLVAATFYRRTTFGNVRDGDAPVEDLDTADGVVGGAVFLQFVLAVATLITLSIWSLRAARNAQRIGAPVSPGLSCGGWYIPFANVIVPFVQLRRILRHGQRATTPVSTWQALVITAFLISGPLARLGDTDSTMSLEDVSSRLSTQVFLAVLSTLLLAATAFVATNAMKELDAVGQP